MEQFNTYKPWHDKMSGITLLKFDQSKFIHYYFYFIDYKCESRVENKGNESSGNAAKKVKEQAREGPDNRGRLNSSQAIQPVKKHSIG